MDIESRPSSPQGPSQNTPSTPQTDRRKSGRVSKKPELFSQNYGPDDSATGGSKRKRTSNAQDDEEEGADEADASEEESEEISDGEPDEEELRAKKRAARQSGSKKSAGSKGKAKPRTPAAKKPKTDLEAQLAFRPATNGKKTVSRPKKTKVRPSLAAGESGLYGDVFGKGSTVDTVAAEWLTKYQRDQSNAMCDLVNFMLRCAGTDLQVTLLDIGDVDHAPARINDIQDQYHAQGFSEYPLISKSRKYRVFQTVLEDFFAALIQTFHHSSILYSDENLFENIQIWISSLSTSSCRPFRHTSTIIALSIMNTLCDVAREVTTTVSTSRKQLENEKKKKSVNKGRAGAIQASVEEGEKKLETLDEFLKDGFNIVFVHRYRDVEPRIRTECMTALGGWMRSYREYFFEGQFLRYFGWILSDSVPQTRGAVITQLLTLYQNKDNLAGMRSFTERFRQRIVEMAAQDADIGVRTSAVELLDLIRDAGLVEPGDVDTVGRLIFDSEPRIRKAAGPFFVANVQDVYDSAIEEVVDEVKEMFGKEDEDDYESPKRSWIRFRCLADTLQAYDEQENELKPERSSATPRGALLGIPVDSRFVLATESIYPHFKDLAQWQSLAGYLLYDHSQIPDAPAEDDGPSVVRNLYKMQEGQEVILLEVLCSAVKLRVLDVAKSDVDRRGRKVKALAERIPELQEEIAHGLAQIIPQLLSKFGSVPEAASAVLRLEHLVDLDKIQDLQKDAAAYTSLLNDINKQFLTHSDQDVLAEASVAFLHAKSSDEIRESMESKVQELWDDVVETLSSLSQKQDVQEGGSISAGTLTALTNTVTRISNLASVTDCTQILETVPSTRSKGKKKDAQEAPFNVFIHLAERGLRGEEEDEDTAQAETELVVNSLKTLLFYFMWKVQSITTALSTGKASFDTAYFETLAKSRETFVSTLVSIMQKRSGLDEIRFAATTTLLDVQTLFGTLRHAGQTASNDEDVILQTQGLVHEIDSNAQTLVGKIHGIAERTYAKKLRRPLEPAEDDVPASDEPEEPSDEENEEDEDESLRHERLRSTIVAEQRLCELTGKIVLAIIGRIIDASGSQRGQLKQKIFRHKSHLGQNYREVISFLNEPKPKSSRSAQSKGKQRTDANNEKDGGKHSNAKSAEKIDDEDGDENGEDEDNVEEDEEEDLQARGLVEDDNNNEENDEEEENQAPEPDEDEVMGDD